MNPGKVIINDHIQFSRKSLIVDFTTQTIAIDQPAAAFERLAYLIVSDVRTVFSVCFCPYCLLDKVSFTLEGGT